jgi:hypothetical protein
MQREDCKFGKLGTLAPLAVHEYDGVSVSLEYMLWDRANIFDPGYFEICIDVRNDSKHTVYWRLPMKKTMEGYLKDLVTNKIYLLLGHSGSLKKADQEFDVLPGGDNTSGMLFAGPGTYGSIFFIMEPVPATVEKFNMILSGFSFYDISGENWDVEFTDVTLRFGLYPTYQN